MKTQIIITVSFLVLATILGSSAASAAGKEHKNVKAENKIINIENTGAAAANHQTTGHHQNQKPAIPKQKDHEKDSIPGKESSHRKGHSDEDGKHHHFHMHRAKKIKRFVNLVCMFAKLVLVLTHICLLAYVLNAPFAH